MSVAIGAVTAGALSFVNGASAAIPTMVGSSNVGFAWK